MTAHSDNRPADCLTLFLILDGFRHDYLDRAEYLQSIAHWRGIVREPFGFISTRPAMCAGLYPDQTGLCFEYQFRPDGPSFGRRLFRALHTARHLFPQKYLRLLATLLVRLTSRAPVPRQTALVGHMPLNVLPLFEFSEDRLQTDPAYLPQPTIYDVLRQQGQRFLYYGFARPKRRFELIKRVISVMARQDFYESDETMLAQYFSALERDRPDFAHLHFSCPDWIGHKFGPDSPEISDAVRRVDDMVRHVHEHAREHYRSVRILASADHGMVKVTEHHDLDAEVLASLSVKQPDDYVCFHDSTGARFWFFTPRARTAVEGALEQVTFGRIVDDAYRERHHLRFQNNMNGDLIFHLNPGVVFLPNYYQQAGQPPKGMHGYDPDVKDNQGLMVVHDAAGRFAVPDGQTLDLVDLFPTLLDMHGLPHPPELPGRSVYAS